MRTHFCGELGTTHIGETVSLCGWVHNRRDHGGVIFIDLRDRKGKAQIVIDPDTPESFVKAESVRSEFVLRVEGTVRERPEGTVNEDLPTGAIELLVSEFTVLNEAMTPPFPIDDIHTYSDTRLRYRVIDLRGDRMRKNMELRAKVASHLRNFLNDREFLEVETPMLTKATPEGARDYLVPSRTQPGRFFALPQSPQLFKQLLMMSGIDRYYQITRCFRDEDLRSDRQPEFTQLDIEMSFMEEKSLTMLMEQMIEGLFEEVLGIILPSPFPRISYQEAMSKYGTDRPDLRNPLQIIEIAPLVKDCDFKVFSKPASEKDGRVAVLKAPGAQGVTRKQIDDYTELVGQHGAKGLAYIKINDLGKGLDGLQSPILKFLDPGIVATLLKIANAENGDLLFFGAGEKKVVDESLGVLRSRLGADLNLIGDDWAPCWIVDFPMFAKNDLGKWTPLHHPFTAPCQGIESVVENPAGAVSRAYDLVLNGSEVGGGSIRIDNPEMQLAVLEMLNIDGDEAEEKFGFLIDSMRYGCPPHGGIAFGLDRLVMLMAGEESIRDVIAFPKTQAATCPLTSAPSMVDERSLKELSLRSMFKASMEK